MMNRTTIILLICVFVFALPAFGLDINPGNYEISAKVQMPGTSNAMPPQTTTQCLTEKDPVPNATTSTQGCTVKDMLTKGNTVTYTMACDQQGMKMISKGKIVFKGDSFEGTTKMKMGPNAGGMTITTIITGKRIGKCDQ